MLGSRQWLGYFYFYVLHVFIVYFLSAVMGKLKVVKSTSKSSHDYNPKKQKPKRWKKGHSCASNPETTKFRQAAKERLFTVNAGTLLR